MRARIFFNDIRGETSACAQDGPPAVPKTDKGVRLMHTRYIPCLGIGYYRCPLEIGSYCYIFNIIILVFMKDNLELKSHYELSLIRMLQEQHILVISQK